MTRAVDLILRKREGGELGRDEYEELVGGYLDGSVMEGQVAAFLMAGVLRGFTDAEARALTDVLWRSGSSLDLSRIDAPTVDKHSTGGVGDGTTLLVAPLLASAGACVVKLSGRGLGHTGGTLDKLEAIPGLRTGLELDELVAVAGAVGCVVAGQTDALVPADRALYALRDVTGTVDAVALIASSVMSKKLAAGAGTIVLDCKAGDGAFMRTAEAALELARLCVAVGTDAGRRCAAVVSGMDAPLGRGIGNALEVAECVRLLQAPPEGRLADVALVLAGLAVEQAGVSLGDGTPEGVRAALVDLWSSGAPLERLRAMVAAQGGDPAVCDHPARVLPAAPVVRRVPAPDAGSVVRIPARAVGEVSATLGAGRLRKGDDVDPAVGVELHVEEGDVVDAGQPLATVHARSEDAADGAVAQLLALVRLGEPGERGPRAPTVLEVVR